MKIQRLHFDGIIDDDALDWKSKFRVDYFSPS